MTIDGKSRSEQPRDDTLSAAVARMTLWAEAKGQAGLVMSTNRWQSLVLRHLLELGTGRYFQAVLGRALPMSQPEIEELAGLATNIWNNTPQPDRGGKSAIDLFKESGGHADRTL